MLDQYIQIGQHDLTYHLDSAIGHLSKEYVSTWTASVDTVHVTMFPLRCVCVYIKHVMETGIRNYFVKPRRNCVEFCVYNI